MLELEAVKLLWDFKIQKDHRIDHNKPDIVVLDRQSRSYLIIVVACPFDTRVTKKEQEKVENYQDLKREIERVWNCHEVKIIPIIILRSSHIFYVLIINIHHMAFTAPHAKLL